MVSGQYCADVRARLPIAVLPRFGPQRDRETDGAGGDSGAVPVLSHPVIHTFYREEEMRGQ